MKKVIVLFLCSVIILISSIPIFADASAAETLAAELLKYYQYEIQAVKLTVSEEYTDWSEYLGDDAQDIRYDLMHQVFYLKMKDTVTAYDSDGSFGANISDRYYWIVPNYNTGGEVQVVRNDDTAHGWAIRRGTHCMTNITTNYPGTEYGIVYIYDNILSNYPNADKLSFRFIYEEDNDIHLMYFTCEDEEYIIPYFSSKDMTWIKNGVIYSAGEYIELMRSNTVDETGGVDLDEGKMDAETIYLNYVVVGSIVVIGIAILAGVLAKSKKKSAEPINEDKE